MPLYVFECPSDGRRAEVLRPLGFYGLVCECGATMRKHVSRAIQINAPTGAMLHPRDHHLYAEMSQQIDHAYQRVEAERGPITNPNAWLEAKEMALQQIALGEKPTSFTTDESMSQGT